MFTHRCGRRRRRARTCQFLRARVCRQPGSESQPGVSGRPERAGPLLRRPSHPTLLHLASLSSPSSHVSFSETQEGEATVKAHRGPSVKLPGGGGGMGEGNNPSQPLPNTDKVKACQKKINKIPCEYPQRSRRAGWAGRAHRSFGARAPARPFPRSSRYLSRRPRKVLGFLALLLKRLVVVRRVSANPTQRGVSTGIKEIERTHMQMNEGWMRRGEGSYFQGAAIAQAQPGLLPLPVKGRDRRRESAGGRSTWQEEMITVTRSIMMMAMSMI